MWPWERQAVVAYFSYYSYSQWFLGSRSLLVVFYFYPISERSPMEWRAPAQGSSRDQCTWGPSSGTTQTQLYSSSTNTFITCSPYTVRGYCTSPALQTSGRGWADSKAVHGMECSGVRSLYWRSLTAGAATWSVPYCLYKKVCSPKWPNTKEPKTRKTPGPVSGWYI